MEHERLFDEIQLFFCLRVDFVVVVVVDLLSTAGTSFCFAELVQYGTTLVCKSSPHQHYPQNQPSS